LRPGGRQLGSHGIEPDPEEAARWKRRLAELGDAEARGWLHYHESR
jgi:TPR repeat protein